MLHNDADTICAVATPTGRGGVSIIRVSGSLAHTICKTITGQVSPPRSWISVSFRNSSGTLIDRGLLLAFVAPHSFTGEDVCELHTHGSPVVTDQLLDELVQLGARLARPGEFSERAFRNDKIDLVQAEAIADLINSSSVRAAQMAVRSLQGEFSARIHSVVAELTNLRIFVEAALDFPDEEVEFIEQGRIMARMLDLIDSLQTLRAKAHQGQILQEGLKVVIAGEPNAGKSTLLNRLSGTNRAIVTDIPGTTRDLLEANILIEGVPVHLIDTAGLRLTDDPVESEGIRRAWQAVEDADRILFVTDFSVVPQLEKDIASWQQISTNTDLKSKTTLVINKIDKTTVSTLEDSAFGVPTLLISALTGDGLSALEKHLLECAGVSISSEDGFIARRRHLSALDQGLANLCAGKVHADAGESELLAEQLRMAQEALGQITGRVTSDELLGLIFSSFCIGK